MAPSLVVRSWDAEVSRDNRCLAPEVNERNPAAKVGPSGSPPSRRGVYPTPAKIEIRSSRK
jgi:hypothetical protein